MNSPDGVPVIERSIRQPTRKFEPVVDGILQKIVAGEWQPDDSLPPEPTLCEMYGISRTVLREAIRVLAQKGFLVVTHGSGMRVTSREQWDELDTDVILARARTETLAEVVEDLLSLRRLIETGTAALAAQRAKPTDVARLRLLCAEMHEAIDDPIEYNRLDIAFHRELVAATRNAIVRRSFGRVSRLTIWWLNLLVPRTEPLRESVRGHEAVVDAIEHRDGVAARQAMEEHLDLFERMFRIELERLGPRAADRLAAASIGAIAPDGSSDDFGLGRLRE